MQRAGPTEVVIDDITIIYDSVYAENIDILSWFVYERADTTFSITCAPSFSACGDPVSYQVLCHATVLIGQQCWFAENLSRSENYKNGDSIASSLSDGEWENTSLGAVAVYGVKHQGTTTAWFRQSSPRAMRYLVSNEYGRIVQLVRCGRYPWLCPSGWHVPSDGEWMTWRVLRWLVAMMTDRTTVG